MVHGYNLKEYHGSRTITWFSPKQEETHARAACMPDLDEFQIERPEQECGGESSQNENLDMPITSAAEHSEAEESAQTSYQCQAGETTGLTQQSNLPQEHENQTSSQLHSSHSSPDITKSTGIPIPDPSDDNQVPDPSPCVYEKRRSVKHFKTKQMLDNKRRTLYSTRGRKIKFPRKYDSFVMK